MRVNFEGRIAIYDQEQLQERLELCRSFVRVLGKGSDTTETVFTDHAVHVWGWQLGDDLLCKWLAVRREPLTQLAWFLCEGKKELENVEER